MKLVTLAIGLLVIGLFILLWRAESHTPSGFADDIWELVHGKSR